MTRFGPLHSSASALIVGDPTRSHLRFDRDEIRYIAEERTAAAYGWADVSRIQLNLPQTRFRYPGATAGVAMSVVALVAHDTLDLEAKPGTATVTRGTETTTVRIDTHHLIGYWRGALTATQRLLDRLLSDAPSRALLNNPDQLVKTVAASKRWFR